MHWATVLMDQNTRCAICGLPTYLLKVYRDRGPWYSWFLGQRECGWRLELDHIVPGDKTGGFRALCHGCNHFRGALVHTDEETLREITYQWYRVSSLRVLWWLNKSPGIGGRLHRASSSEKREQRYAEARRAHERSRGQS